MLVLTREGKSCKTVIRPDKAGEGALLFPLPSPQRLPSPSWGITPKGSEKDAYSPGVSENHDFIASVTLDLSASSDS